MSYFTEDFKKDTRNDEPPVARPNYKSKAVFFQNTIRSQGRCGPGCDRSGVKQYLINKDPEHRYRVTVVSIWSNKQTGQLETHTRIHKSEPGGEIYLGCDYLYISGNGETRVTRKITGEVKIAD